MLPLPPGRMAMMMFPPGPFDATNNKPCAVTGVGATHSVRPSTAQSSFPLTGSYPFTRWLPLTTISSRPFAFQMIGVDHDRVTWPRGVCQIVLPVVLSTASRKSSPSVSTFNNKVLP